MLLNNSLLLFILLIPLICYGKEFSPEFVKHVFLNLDMTSFPNSTAAQGYPHDIITMKDSFKIRKEHKVRKCSSNNCVQVFFPFSKDNITSYDIKSPGWIYNLKILDVNNNKITACFTDYCNSVNCSYKTSQPLKIKKKKDKYIVVASYTYSIKGCSFYKS
ncbi:hypothetical protein ACIMMX_004917 [Salmonella enterica subsp. enterica serovar Newport]|nr:hypothetical protein [Salmonella enterica subsp. enterica serovar Newport]EHM0998969.1 hypothetical protein [Salmonella enterica subsp. enterica serovar Newport]